MMTYRALHTIQALALCLTLFGMACATTQTTPAALPQEACSRGALGIEPDDISREFRTGHRLPDDLQGSVVAMALEGGPASSAGVLRGDVLLEVGDRPIANSCDAIDALFDGGCDPVDVIVWRDGARLSMTLTPAPEQTFLARKCRGGIPAACFRLGWLLWSGTGVPADEPRALGLYREACDNGWAESCAFLGLHLMDTSASGIEIVKVLERSCDLGSSAGCAHLAYLYATGTKVKQDDARATPLYVRACDLGDPLGCFNVGLMYNSGRGVAADSARALAAYEEGCRGGSSSACTDLGWFYENGEGVETDGARAVELYRKGCDGTSCQSPNRLGCVNLGRAYRDGIGVAADPAKAAEIFRTACEGDVDPDDISSDENRSHACSLLGAMYFEGQGVERSNETGLELSERGCESKDSFGCFNAAIAYANGLGVDVDMTEAAKYYQLACDYEDAEGCYKLSLLYADGNGVVKNTNRAKELSQKACAGGFAEACATKAP